MPPSEERRFRIAFAIVLPVAGVLGWVASANDWSVGWIYLSLFILFAMAAAFVHFRPGDRWRRR